VSHKKKIVRIYFSELYYTTFKKLTVASRSSEVRMTMLSLLF